MPPVERRLPATGGVHLHVRLWQHGAEAPVLLVHGLASNARLWDGCAEALADLGHPVAAVDQRGHGRSDKPDAGYDYPTVTADLLALIDALGWHRPVVAGQSWGGNVAVELAARHPGAVDRVVAVDGGFLRLGLRFPTWEACAAALAPPATEGMPYRELEATVRRMHPDWPESGIAGALACWEVRADGTVAPWLTRARHLQILRTLWEEDLAEVWSKVDAPVLLVACDDGTAAITAEARSVEMAAKRAAVDDAAAAIPDATVRWFTADHDVHAQHPVETAELIHEFATRSA